MTIPNSCRPDQRPPASELDDLYQEVILDHSKHPRNFHDLPDATHHAEGYNALCGDRVRVFLKLDGQQLNDIAFTGAGCAICNASASLMTESVKGKTRGQIESLFDLFHHLLTDSAPSPDNAQPLGKLAVFSGVRKYPMRVKCATLPWHTLKAALDSRAQPVTTE